MGNKPSNNQEPNRSSIKRTTTSNLSQETRQKLENWLKYVPFSLNSAQTRSIFDAVTQIEVESPRMIVHKGEDPVGIYVVVSGKVEVVSEREQYVLREVPVGECFGEVSVMYDTKCTADVRVATRASLLSLQTSDARRLFTLPPDIPLLEWFSRRKYIDTSGLFGSQELSKDVAVTALEKAPMLQGWSVEALKQVINSIKQGIIVLYPAGSAIYREGVTGNEVFLLLQGRVQFTTEDQELAMFDAGERGFCFGEEGIFASTERRSTARALTSCQIITLEKENFYHAINKHPTEHTLLQMVNEKWKEHVGKRDPELYKKYGGALDLEILRMALKQNQLFQSCSSGFLYIIALAMEVKEVQEEQAVLSHAQYTKGDKLFLVLQGSAVVTEGQQDVFHTINVKQVFRKSSAMPVKAWVKATQVAVVAFFSWSAITEAQSAYPEEFLITQTDP